MVVFIMLSACSVEKENETYHISLAKNYEISDVDFSSIINVEVINDFVVIFSIADSGYTVSIYDYQSETKIKEVSINDDEFLLVDYDLSDNCLYLSGVNLLSNENVVDVYDLFSSDVEQIYISKYNDEMFYEGNVEIFNDYAFIHMFTGFSGKGINYVMDLEDRSISKIQEYEILNVVMDATLIDVYNTKDILTENHIYFSALNYTDTYNYIGVYDVESKNLVELSFDDAEQTCDIESSSNFGDKLLVKTICGDVTYLIVYDIYTVEEDFRIVYPFDNSDNESNISAVNRDYVLFSNGNYERYNAEVKLYDIQNMEMIDIPNIDSIEWFGSNVFLYNDLVIIVSSENKIYKYNINGRTMEQVNLLEDVDQVFNVVNGFIIYQNAETNLLMAYNMDTESQQVLNSDYSDIASVQVKDSTIFVVYDNQFPIIEIYDITTME
jgi:hypothetical protein